MAWDSTGQEGVFAWATYFNDTVTATNALNSILAYQPTVPHWGYNGNARRYWSVDNNPSSRQTDPDVPSMSGTTFTAENFNVLSDKSTTTAQA